MEKEEKIKYIELKIRHETILVKLSSIVLVDLVAGASPRIIIDYTNGGRTVIDESDGFNLTDAYTHLVEWLGAQNRYTIERVERQ